MLAYPHARLAAVRRWVNAWYDSPRALPILLGLFVIAWWAIQTISFSSIGLHDDVVEMFAWGRHLEPGYYKHPPLGALMSRAWFAVFPATDWSAHLMAMVNAGLSLYFVDLIARRYVVGDKRLMVLLLLLFTPFYQFHAVRFSANAALLVTWPLATYCFIRAFESRGIGWGAAAGATAALAMLAKYFSIYLIGGFVLAAMVHPARLRYLRSPSPWVSVGVGFVVLVPHIRWLLETGFQTFQYAFAVHGASWLAAAATVPRYLLGAAGYFLLPTIVFAWAARPRAAEVLAALWPSHPEGRLLAALFWGPLLLPALTAPFLGLELTSLWTMQCWFLLPILLLMPEQIRMSRDGAVGVAVTVIAFTAVMLVVSPALAWFKFRTNPEARAYFQPVARELARRWHDLTDRPLTIVLGDFSVPATFYVPNHPDSVTNFSVSTVPWVTPERMAQEGFAVICRDESCAARALQLAADKPNSRRVDADIVPTFLGESAPPMHVVLILAPPRPDDPQHAAVSEPVPGTSVPLR